MRPGAPDLIAIHHGQVYAIELKAETPRATVLPFEAGEHHAWLHAECWPAWHQSPREEAALALRRMGIVIRGSLRDHNE